MGARPLRRVIQLKVEDRLSDAVLAEQFEDGDTVLVDVDPRRTRSSCAKKATRESAAESETAYWASVHKSGLELCIRC